MLPVEASQELPADARATGLVFLDGAKTSFLALDGGRDALPAISAHNGLVVRALFWEKTLAELEIEPGLVTLGEASQTRLIPRTPEERAFETNMTLVGPTPWAALGAAELDALHELKLKPPSIHGCAALDVGDACRVASDGEGSEASYCDTDCMVAAPAAPVLPGAIDPPQTFVIDCPQGQWPEGQWVPDGEESVHLSICAPPPAQAYAECDEGEHHLPGGAGCEPVGSPCPAGDFTEKTLPRPVIYVKEGSIGNGSTPELAVGSLQQAIDEAPAGATISVGKGTYREPLILSKPLLVVGACSRLTKVEVVGGKQDRALLVVHSATMEDLAITGSPAIEVESEAVLTLDGVALKQGDSASFAVSVREDSEVRGREVSMRGFELAVDVSRTSSVSLEEVSTDARVLAQVAGGGSRARFSRLIAVPADGFTDPSTVEDGAELVLESAVLREVRRGAVVARGAGTRVRLNDVALRSATTATASQVMISLREGAQLDANTLVLDGARGGAVLAEGSGTAIRAAHLLIRDGGDDSPYTMVLADRAGAVLEKSAILRASSTGVRLCGVPLADCSSDGPTCGAAGLGGCGSLEAQGLLILGRQQGTAGAYGVIADPGTRFEADGLVMADLRIGGLFVGRASIASITDGRIGDLQTSEVQYGIALPAGDASLQLTRVQLFDIGASAIEMSRSNARAELSHVTLNNVSGRGGFGSCRNPAIAVTDDALLTGDHLDLETGGGLAFGSSAEGTLTDIDARGMGERALCVDGQATVTVDRLRSVRSSSIAVYGAGTVLEASNLELRGAGLVAEGGARLTISQLSIEAPTQALELDVDMASTFDDVRVQASERGIELRSRIERLQRFAIDGAAIGLAIEEGVDVELITEGRITRYQDYGVRVRDERFDLSRLFFRIVYDSPENAVHRPED